MPQFPPTATSSPENQKEADRYARLALVVGTAVFVGVYVGLFFSGLRFFVFKTAVLPIFVVYAMLVRDRVRFLADWLPLLAFTVLFDAARGDIYLAVERWHLHQHAVYPVAFNRLLFGVPALAVSVQQWRVPSLDLAATFIHASHFAFFLLFGLTLWHARRAHFTEFRRALMLVMLIGLVGYALVPTIPPWLASQSHLVPPIAHIVDDVYNQYARELYGTFDTNPVAAMPSLHVAFPTTCALISWRAYSRGAACLVTLYALLVMAAVVYLGEHYVLDVIAGVATAAATVTFACRLRIRPLSIAESFIFTGASVSLTVALLWVAASRL
jgi:membrane-associated phospholipid phosphatase